MKDKIFKVIGEVTYILLKLTLAISIMILISLIVFEIKKEEIWMEAVESFSMLYDTKVKEIYERHGIVNEHQEWKYEDPQWISINPERKSKTTVPDLEEEAIGVCIDKLVEAEQEIGPEKTAKIMICVNEQLIAAKIILHQYMLFIEAMDDDNPTKIILKKVVVNCNETNKNTEGLVDHVNMLECLRNEVKRLNEMLDEELDEVKRKHGI